MAVLLVDDQAINRVLASALLRSLNLDVIEATNGREGLLAYLRHGRDRIAFVFLDLMMPVWDGFRAALSIRSAESERGWQQVPIVAFTSEDVSHGSPMFDKCMRSGFNDAVPKPMSLVQATELLSHWLPNQRLAKQPVSVCCSTASRGTRNLTCACAQAGCGRCLAFTAEAAGAAGATAVQCTAGVLATVPIAVPNSSARGPRSGGRLPPGSEAASATSDATYFGAHACLAHVPSWPASQ